MKNKIFIQKTEGINKIRNKIKEIDISKDMIIFEKNDRFNKQDVEGNLCVMLLMLQSSNRDNKETLRMQMLAGIKKY